MPAQPTRLCVVLPSHWAAGMGGAEMQVRMLVERLAGLSNFDVHYVARQTNPSHVPSGYRVHQLRSHRDVSGSFIFDVPGLIGLLNRLQPDVIYQRVACAYTGAAAYFARKNRRRMVWHVSSDRDLIPLPWRLSFRWPIHKLDKHLVEYGLRHSDAIIVQTAQQAKLLHDNYGRSDAVQIRNFHPAAREPIVKRGDRLIVCWIGNIKRLKQPEVFLRLAHDFRHRPGIEFVMVGAQQMRADIWSRLVADMATIPNLRYIGPQSQNAVEDLLSCAHVLVNTSPVEGFPNTFIQAWLREVPVVTLAVNPDGVFDSDQYGICADGSYERLRTALESLVANEALRNQMGKNASRFAREQFSEANIDRIIQLFELAG